MKALLQNPRNIFERSYYYLFALLPQPAGRTKDQILGKNNSSLSLFRVWNSSLLNLVFCCAASVHSFCCWNASLPLLMIQPHIYHLGLGTSCFLPYFPLLRSFNYFKKKELKGVSRLRSASHSLWDHYNILNMYSSKLAAFAIALGLPLVQGQAISLNNLPQCAVCLHPVFPKSRRALTDFPSKAR